MLRTVDLFQQKPGIIKKAEEKLTALNLALQNLISNGKTFCPENADRTKGQIARGENHKGFPYLSLDMPQLLNKKEFFTFRTLFWWGHYLGFSLILKGGDFKEYQTQLQQNRQVPGANEDIFFSVSETPWVWEIDSTAHQRLVEIQDEKIIQHCDQAGFIKLLKVYPMSRPEFSSLDWTAIGLETYQAMITLISKPV
ncbi:MAG: hypothetical protein G3M70_14220 [Candidatus Nitronauta litoralis]|uniref:Uncharacterized protein n=1 Tax=Candidatus Nitronauta litoralis TaxID=2705533 RepID=A0A7T0BY30_9BACT|nr:MAG: hypothetical protein G3M70_14220 [Candidatus Nitronauta litoralis]